MNATSITAVTGGITAATGYQASAVACGLKPSGLDLALIVSDPLASAAGVFTTNRAVAAPAENDDARHRAPLPRLRQPTPEDRRRH